MSAEQPRRKRRSRGTGQRTRTGCITCKIRRVKCDETKPRCRKCADSMRPCDGYELPGPIRRGSRSPQSSSPANTVDVYKPRNSRETRSFEYFFRQTLPQLVSNFDSDFWSRFVLQVRHHEPAIEHALAALGAAHEKRDLFAARRKGIGDRSEDEIIAQRTSLQQYNKSIRALSGRMTARGPAATELALVCCVLYICLETLKRNTEIALKHLQNGVNVYQGWKEQSSGSGITGSLFEASGELEDSIFSLFTRLDTQATGFPDGNLPRLRTTDPSVDIPGVAGSQRPTFPNISTAKKCLDRIYSHCALFLITNQRYKKQARKTLPADVLTAYTTIMSQMSAFEDVFLPYAEILEQGGTEKDRRGVMILRMSLKALRFIAQRGFSDRALEPNEDEFSAILDIASALIGVPDPTPRPFPISPSLERHMSYLSVIRPNPNPSNAVAKPPGFISFSLDADLIPPLYLVAQEASSLKIRRRAITLLRSVDTQEGLWSSAMVADVAEKTLEALEAGLANPNIAQGIAKLSEAVGVMDDLFEEEQPQEHMVIEEVDE